MDKENSRPKGRKLKNYIQIICIIIFIISICIIIYYFYNSSRNKQEYKKVLNDIKVDEELVTEEKTERILQVEELKKENQDIVGWIEIEGTNISYPVVQGTDNQYYIKHTYKKEYSNDGSIFLDKSYDWNLPSTNLLIYGHNNKNGIMFQELLKYKEESFYKEHPTIRFTNINEDCQYEIISVFYSRVYYKNEKNVFRYYYFINAENEEEYNNYIEESKKASIYDTGITAIFGEQLLTLSTCEYSQEDGRFVIVAKKVK